MKKYLIINFENNEKLIFVKAVYPAVIYTNDRSEALRLKFDTAECFINQFNSVKIRHGIVLDKPL